MNPPCGRGQGPRLDSNAMFRLFPSRIGANAESQSIYRSEQLPAIHHALYVGRYANRREERRHHGITVERTFAWLSHFPTPGREFESYCNSPGSA